MMKLTEDLLKNDSVSITVRQKKRENFENNFMSRLIFTGCIFIFIFMFSSFDYAKSLSPKSAQWTSAGGRIVASGMHKFKQSDPASGIFKGTFTVRGPGYIGVIYREIKSISPGVGLRGSDKRVFLTRHLGSQSLLKGSNGKWKWEPPVMNTEAYKPNANKGGWVPKPTRDNPTTTLEVWVTIEGGGIKNDNRAIEYEFWYFPLNDGKVITTNNQSKPAISPIKKQSENSSHLNPVADNHVYAYSYRNWNKTNWGQYKMLGAGWNPTGGEKRTYLKFDLKGIHPNRVKNAKLRLYHHHTGGRNAVDLGVYRVMSPWIEGNGTYIPSKIAAAGELTWVYQPKIDQHPVVNFNPGQGVNKWIEVDVTSLINAWLKGIPNHGMVIKCVDNLLGKPEAQYGFYSREFEDIGKRPMLVLNGIPDYNLKPSFSLGNVWTVKEFDGNSIWEATWKRRGTTNIFDAKWRNNKTGHVVKDVIEYKGMKGGKVILYRRGIRGEYTGTLPNNRTGIIKGTASWYKPNWYWEAKIK